MLVPTRRLPDQFLVAFSFAGEQRELVRAVAEAVELELGPASVFLDEWFEYYIAGADADIKLQQIYSAGCVLAVVCISKQYGDKPWTRAEHTAIRARYMKAQGLREELGILPLRVGEGEVEGIPFNAIAPDIRLKTPREAAKLIIDRLHHIVPDLRALPVPDWPEHSPPLYWSMAATARRAVRSNFY